MLQTVLFLFVCLFVCLFVYCELYVPVSHSTERLAVEGLGLQNTFDSSESLLLFQYLPDKAHQTTAIET